MITSSFLTIVTFIKGSPGLGMLLSLLYNILQVIVFYPIKIVYNALIYDKTKLESTVTSWKKKGLNIKLAVILFFRSCRKEVHAQEEVGALDVMAQQELPDCSDGVSEDENRAVSFGYHLSNYLFSIPYPLRKKYLTYVFGSLGEEKNRRTEGYKKRMANYLFDFYGADKVIEFLFNGFFRKTLLKDYKSNEASFVGEDLLNNRFEKFYDRYGSLMKTPWSNTVWDNSYFKERLVPKGVRNIDAEYFQVSVAWRNKHEKMSFRRVRDLARISVMAVFSDTPSQLNDVQKNYIYQMYCKGDLMYDFLDFVFRSGLSSYNRMEILRCYDKYCETISNEKEKNDFQNRMKELIEHYQKVNQEETQQVKLVRNGGIKSILSKLMKL